MLVRRVIDDQLGDHPQSAPMRLVHDMVEVRARAVHRVDVGVIGDIVPVVAQGRRVEGKEPDGIDPQVLHVVQLFCQAGEVADAVVVGVEKGLDMELVDDGVLVPVGGARRGDVDGYGCGRGSGGRVAQDAPYRK